MGYLGAVMSWEYVDMPARNETAINEAKETRILRRKQVEQRTGLSRSGIYSKMTRNVKRPSAFDPTFPRPIPLGTNCVGWVESEIDNWLNAQIAKRDAE